MFNLFGGPFEGALDGTAWNNESVQWLKPIVAVLDQLIIPITIVVAIAGAIWIIILGVKLARAETADKAKEAKGALIRVAIAIVASLVLIWLLTWFATNITTLFNIKPFDGLNSSGSVASN